jgi:hypothetical protein
MLAIIGAEPVRMGWGADGGDGHHGRLTADDTAGTERTGQGIAWALKKGDACRAGELLIDEETKVIGGMGRRRALEINGGGMGRRRALESMAAGWRMHRRRRFGDERFGGEAMRATIRETCGGIA